MPRPKNSIPNNFVEIVNSSRSMKEAGEKLEIPFTTFKRYAEALGVYKPNQSLKGIAKGGRSLKDILEGKFSHYRNSSLRDRLVRAAILEDKCCRCGWDKKRKGCLFSTCEIHHKNGNHYDNKLENLEYLCPNCHSLTDDFRSSRKAKVMKRNTYQTKNLAPLKA